MEIVSLSQSGLRVKGKQASIVVDTTDKNPYNAAILLSKTAEDANLSDAPLIIAGPGEYEVGGIKISGTRSEGETVYSMTVDGVEILLGKVKSLDRLQHKLKEHDIVLASCPESTPAAFLTTLASNVIIFHGVQGEETSKTFGAANMQQAGKYTTTKDKLPQEVETILLQ